MFFEFVLILSQAGIFCNRYLPPRDKKEDFSCSSRQADKIRWGPVEREAAAEPPPAEAAAPPHNPQGILLIRRNQALQSMAVDFVARIGGSRWGSGGARSGSGASPSGTCRSTADSAVCCRSASGCRHCRSAASKAAHHRLRPPQSPYRSFTSPGEKHERLISARRLKSSAKTAPGKTWTLLLLNHQKTADIASRPFCDKPEKISPRCSEPEPSAERARQTHRR